MSYNKLLASIKRIIEKHMNQNITADYVAQQLGMNRMQLHRLIKRATGKSTSDYILQVKMEKAQQLLLRSEMKVKDIGRKVGYPDSSYFSKVFKKKMGYLPRAYRMKYSLRHR